MCGTYCAAHDVGRSIWRLTCVRIAVRSVEYTSAKPLMHLPKQLPTAVLFAGCWGLSRAQLPIMNAATVAVEKLNNQQRIGIGVGGVNMRR